MARLEISLEFEDYLLELERLYGDTPEISKKVVMAGAQPVADEIRARIENLPEDTFRRLKKEEKFKGLPDSQKNDLLESLGIAEPDIDYNGNTNTKVGFKGYGGFPTKKYPKGLPNALLARSVESGSSVRKKTPFVRPGTNKARPRAIAAMQDAINVELKIYAL